MTVIEAGGAFNTKRALEADEGPVIYDPEVGALAILTAKFRALAERCGLQWTQDDDREVGHAVELLLDAATLDRL